VAHLGVEEAVQEVALDHGATADTRTDSEVDEGVEAACHSPAMFSESCAVDVGVEADRQSESPPHRSGQVGLSPAELGCRGDMSPGGRVRIRIDGAERGDAYC
jgi:hypothetical protein